MTDPDREKLARIIELLEKIERHLDRIQNWPANGFLKS